MNTIQEKIETETKYPLIIKYVVSDKDIDDFFSNFTVEQLDDFEQSLDLYFNKQDIKYNPEYDSLESTEGHDFNKGIIRLACSLITYKDFVEDYKLDYSEVVLSKVMEYFREYKIKNLMEYGNDSDEGLYKLSSLYKKITDNLGIKYYDINTRDKEGSDGRFITTIIFNNKSELEVETDAWSGIKVVTENVKSIYENFKNLSFQTIKNRSQNELEFEY